MRWWISAGYAGAGVVYAAWADRGLRARQAPGLSADEWLVWISMWPLVELGFRIRMLRRSLRRHR